MEQTPLSIFSCSSQASLLKREDRTCGRSKLPALHNLAWAPSLPSGYRQSQRLTTSTFQRWSQSSYIVCFPFLHFMSLWTLTLYLFHLIHIHTFPLDFNLAWTKSSMKAKHIRLPLVTIHSRYSKERCISHKNSLTGSGVSDRKPENWDSWEST